MGPIKEEHLMQKGTQRASVMPVRVPNKSIQELL